jgi:hypothetical protein
MMGELRAILIDETEKARQFKIAGRQEPVWIPRSLVSKILKYAPDAKGHRECVVTVEDWWLEKNDL